MPQAKRKRIKIKSTIKSTIRIMDGRASREDERVAPGDCSPGAPTDPYVLALEHTVPQNHVCYFEAQLDGFRTRCLRFAASITRTPRKTRSRLPVRLYRTGFSPAEDPMKGFCLNFL